MEKELYQRTCPDCGKTIEYKTFRTFNEAKIKNSKCRECANKIWRLDHPNTKCCICNTPIYRCKTRLTDHPFCSYACRNKYYSGDKNFNWNGGPKERNKRVRIKDKERKLKNKQRAIDLLGGCCQNCGYDRYIGALEFHHKNPNQKDISVKNIFSCSWNRIKEEVIKCKLLCANCHREEHEKLRKENERTKYEDVME